MALVTRFQLPEEVKAKRDVWVSGVGLLVSGIYDVPSTDTGTIATVWSILQPLGATRTDSFNPPPGSSDPSMPDPYPQYMTATELVSSIQGGTDSVGVALKTAYASRLGAVRTIFNARARSSQPTVMGAPPTITFTAGPGLSSSITNAVTVPVLLAPNAPALDPRYTHLGAPLVNRGTSGFSGIIAQAQSGSGGGGTPLLAGGYMSTIDIIFDGPVIELTALMDGAPWAYRIWIDDAPVATHSQSQGTASNGNDNKLKIDFASRAVRRIRIDFARQVGPIQCWIGPQDTVTPAPVRAGNLLVVGDSFVDGANGISTLDTYASSLITLLGAGNYYLDGQGGTGFTSNGGGSSKDVYLTRINLVPDGYTPDLVLLQGSTNDSGAAGLSTAVATAIARCRARWPKALLVLTGLLWPQAYSGFGADSQTNHSTLATFTSSVDVFIDPVTEAWFSGTGYVGATTGTGNADIYRSSDTLHPAQTGHDYIAARVARDILSALTAIAPNP